MITLETNVDYTPLPPVSSRYPNFYYATRSNHSHLNVKAAIQYTFYAHNFECTFQPSNS